MKYSDYFVDQLVSMGYTHCFYLSGGNVMHLLESARTRLECIAVAHEVSAAIAAEYFNVANRNTNKRAFVMVTAGPGLTNLVSGIAGAWLESRELLIVGGQARTNFLSRGTVRQIGHQEIDGVSITKNITKKSVRIETPISASEIEALILESKKPRKGPVFLEVCLDVTLMEIEERKLERIVVPHLKNLETRESVDSTIFIKLTQLLKESSRPLILIGGGVSYSVFKKVEEKIAKTKIAIATTWNAADYLDFDDEAYAGRPNTYGMRWSNAVIQQSDFLLAIGARLGLQQTGFAWEQFAPLAKKVQVDVDEFELNKENPNLDLGIQMDADKFLEELGRQLDKIEPKEKWSDWREFIKEVKEVLPVNESCNRQYSDFVNPFDFIEELSDITSHEDKVIPCSSGGAYTSIMQAFRQKSGQLLTNNKGLASMGYGLAGAIGTSIADPSRKVILVEGDGGFAQNLQELGTVSNQNLNLKMFIFDNSGYASIRISQKAYFDGNYLGCDSTTGIGLPNWEKLFDAFGIKCHVITGSFKSNAKALEDFNSASPVAFILKIHQEQPFLPKITSKVSKDGKIVSNPIHLMAPELPTEVANEVFKYLPRELRSV